MPAAIPIPALLEEIKEGSGTAVNILFEDSSLVLYLCLVVLHRIIKNPENLCLIQDCAS